MIMASKRQSVIDIKKGLEGVVVAESKVCAIDGEKGRLVYRGYNIKDLAECSFEEVSFLLVSGRLPNRTDLESYKRMLARRRYLSPRLLKLMHDYCPNTTGMEALRTTVSALACHDKDARKVSLKDHALNGIDLIAQFQRPSFCNYFGCRHAERSSPWRRCAGSLAFAEKHRRS
jgi:citrate synthase